LLTFLAAFLAALLPALLNVAIDKSLHDGLSVRGLSQQRPDLRLVQAGVGLDIVAQQGGRISVAWVWSPIWRINASSSRSGPAGSLL
jgi:hypothetical protein